MKRRAIFIGGMWSIPAIIGTADIRLFANIGGVRLLLWQAALMAAPRWLIWIALTPFIFLLARRFPVEWPLRASSCVVHVSAALGSLIIQSAVYIASAELLAMLSPLVVPVNFGRSLMRDGPAAVLTYVAVVGVWTAFDLNRQQRAREVHSATLAAQLSEARLDALRSQLNPHFLFNSLNALSALVIDHEEQWAVATIERLGSLLRYALEGDDEPYVSLREEIGALNHYLGIERMRFGNALQVEWHVALDVQTAVVPRLLLQPAVENAVRHGVSRLSRPGTVRISARLADTRLIIDVDDDGPGLPPNWSLSTHARVGLTNTIARLAEEYGSDADLRIAPRRDCGTRVSFSLPFTLSSL
jgi:two-component system LytT family sensor kinase